MSFLDGQLPNLDTKIGFRQTEPWDASENHASASD